MAATNRPALHFQNMARYFFHVHNDVETRDELGQEFPNLEAARASAARDCIALAVHSITNSATSSCITASI
ncbi:DUF6894 family protein [Sphingomonas qilianensis]|uniref:DUF6894 family protein n=1 Tax=Sphingomonas qilianensis TaxID=1736690 RepID=UPI00361B2FDA